MPRKKKATGRPKRTTAERRKREREIKKQQHQYYQQRLQTKANPKKSAKEKQQKQILDLTTYLTTLIDYNFDQHIFDRRGQNPHAEVLRDTMPNLQFSLAFFNNRFYKEERKYFLQAPSVKELTKQPKVDILNQILANYKTCINIFADIFIFANIGTPDTTNKHRVYLKNVMFRKFLDNLDTCSHYIDKKVNEISKMIISNYLDSNAFKSKYTHQPGILLSLYTPRSDTDVSNGSLYKNKQMYYAKIDHSLCLYGADYSTWQQILQEKCIEEQINPQSIYSPQIPASLRKRIFLKTISDFFMEKGFLYKKTKNVEGINTIFCYQQELKNIDHKDAIIFTTPNFTQTKPIAPIYKSEQASAVFILQLYSSFLNYIQRKNTKLTSLSADLSFINDYPTQYLPSDRTLTAYKRYFLIYSLLFLFPRLSFEETTELQEIWTYCTEEFEDLKKVKELSEKMKNARSIQKKIEYFSKALHIATFYANLCFFPVNHFEVANLDFINTDNPAEIFERINTIKKVNISNIPNTSRGAEILNKMCHFIIPQIDTITGFDANSFLLNF